MHICGLYLVTELESKSMGCNPGLIHLINPHPLSKVIFMHIKLVTFWWKRNQWRKSARKVDFLLNKFYFVSFWFLVKTIHYICKKKPMWSIFILKYLSYITTISNCNYYCNCISNLFPFRWSFQRHRKSWRLRGTRLTVKARRALNSLKDIRALGTTH